MLRFSPEGLSASLLTVRATSPSLPVESGRETRSSVLRFLPPSLMVPCRTSLTCQFPAPSGSSVVFLTSVLLPLRCWRSSIWVTGIILPLMLGCITVVFVSSTSRLIFLVSEISCCTTWSLPLESGLEVARTVLELPPGRVCRSSSVT